MDSTKDFISLRFHHKHVNTPCWNLLFTPTVVDLTNPGSLLGPVYGPGAAEGAKPGVSGASQGMLVHFFDALILHDFTVAFATCIYIYIFSPTVQTCIFDSCMLSRNEFNDPTQQRVCVPEALAAGQRC